MCSSSLGAGKNCSYCLATFQLNYIILYAESIMYVVVHIIELVLNRASQWWVVCLLLLPQPKHGGFLQHVISIASSYNLCLHNLFPITSSLFCTPAEYFNSPSYITINTSVSFVRHLLPVRVIKHGLSSCLWHNKTTIPLMMLFQDMVMAYQQSKHHHSPWG